MDAKPAGSMPVELDWQRLSRLLSGVFIFSRLVLLLALPLEGLRGYGDLPNFFQQAALPGWPYLNYWSEFPPIFPLLSSLIYRLAGGQEHVYDYLLIAVLSLADAGNLLLFSRLARHFHTPGAALPRVLVYFAVLAAFPYQWWYFDPLAVLCMLLAIFWITTGRDTHAVLAATAGTLVKFFPFLALVWIWRSRPPRRVLSLTALALGLVIAVYGLLAILSPDFTLAGLRSQGSKGSWETVWALLDGNYQTGNFGPYTERLDPAAALQPRGRPARVPPLLTLAVFGAAGLTLFLRSKKGSHLAGLSLVGLAFCLALLCSPGWSVQWCLYLLPLILLAFPERLAFLLSALLVLVNLMEWPVLLSRGLFTALPGPILLRSLLLGLMAYLFYRQARTGEIYAGR